MQAAACLIDAKTLLVSVHGANNEIGTLQPIKAISEIAHAHGALVHCDASQMLGKVPVSVDELNVDFASFSGHKLYGPKGIGILFVRRGSARLAIGPILLGGGQEAEFRPGTLNVPAIVGLAEACRQASIPTTTTNNPTFDSVDRFLKYLKDQRKSVASHLTKLQCKAFAEYVKKLNTAGPPRDFIFPGYEVVERLYQHAERAEVVARRTDIRHRKLSRLRIFYPPVNKSEVERRRAHERATATLNAVSKIGDHPNVLKVWAIPNENNFLVEGSDWSETGTLRDVLAREGALSTDRATAITSGLVRGLHAVHEQCVIHRAVSPENVLIVDNIPKLMNFDLSFQVDGERLTVIPDSSELKRSPYIAAEIYFAGPLHEAADLFSVGVVFYEMLTGERPFGCSTDLEQSNGGLGVSHRKTLASHQVPRHFIDLIFDLVQLEPSKRPATALLVLKRLEGVQDPAVVVQNPLLAPGDRSGLYAIEQFFGKGAESQIYRAVGARGRQIALKLFDRDVLLQRVVDEQRFAASVHHPCIVRVDSPNQWTDGRYYIPFEWVSDRSLRDEIVAGESPDIARFSSFARQILDALATLHSNSEEGIPRPILHNDIKPDNILLAEGDRPVLIDFGAASEPHVGTYEGTEGYVAPDLRLGQDRKYCEDGDLYALAVTLHEWLVGSRPGACTAAVTEVPAALLTWLRTGSSSDSSLRFTSAKHMRDALDAALASKEATPSPIATEVFLLLDETSVKSEAPGLNELTVLSEGASDPNSFVPYLNSLHSRTAETDSALAESQARNPLFGFIHVPHPLVKTIEGILLGQDRRHVIVTGHAGDGKSTIAVELVKRLMGLSIDKPLTEPLSPRKDIKAGQTTISVIKDFSEWSPAQRREVLTEMLDPLGGRFFVISNTGTMLDTFKVHEQSGDWVRIESDLLGAMSNPRPSDIDFHETLFRIVNVAMMDNLGIAEQIFERMLAAERWQACTTAECRPYCPIFANVSLIQANQEVVKNRLFLAYRRMYEYGTRLTLRQLCAHMAYMITSGLSYTDVIKFSQRASPPPMTEFMFFNRFFGDNGKTLDGPALQIRAVRAVREQGFGDQPCPAWERKLWSRSRGQSFLLRAAWSPADFDSLRQDGAARSVPAADAREQVRRAVFFLHRFDAGDDRLIASFLNSVMLLDFARWQSQQNATLSLQETTSLHRRIMHVLQEHFSGVRLPEGAVSDRHLFVTLSRRSQDVRQSAQVVLTRCPEETFQVQLTTRDNGAGGIRRELILDGRARSPQLLLPLGLPFLDYVIMRNQGEVGRILEASYVDRLERFKGQLISSGGSERSDDIMLVRLRTNNTFRRQIFSVRGDRLEVTDG